MKIKEEYGDKDQPCPSLSIEVIDRVSDWGLGQALIACRSHVYCRMTGSVAPLSPRSYVTRLFAMRTRSAKTV